jgi:Protein of unknown function (DUF3224)
VTIKNHFVISAILLATLTIIASTMTQAQSISKETVTLLHAGGPFDVKVTHQDENTGDPLLNRMTLDKQYHGDLEATGKGQMLTAGTEVKGSAGYVAIEKVTGSLKGRVGSFVLQHTGTMTRNVPELNIAVVPDSGTGELKGLSGKMKINIAGDGKHSYDFEYTLPAH